MAWGAWSRPLRHPWLWWVLGSLAAIGILWVVRTDQDASDWRAGLVIGSSLLAMAAIVGIVVMASSRRELASAQELLGAASGDLRQAFDELETAHRSLGDAVVARDQALVRLRAATRDREIFLTSIAHDLKTPLTVIKGHADLLASMTRANTELEAARVSPGLARISTSTRQMTAMIEEFLWLASLDLDRTIEYHGEPTDLVALVRQVIESHAAAAPNHTLELQAKTPVLVGEWDPDRIERMLTNLLSNAVKYSPQGSTVVVTVWSDEGGFAACLSVRDQGIGIPAADLVHVFERFFRGGNVPGDATGTGFGLASVRQIVNGFGGTIDVESEEGHGATFTVRMPVRSGDPASATPTTMGS